jgi:diguanylate cyclase (GGDEF)-like protein
VSLFVPASARGHASATLIHSGDVAAVPELAEVSAAEEWAASAEPEPAAGSMRFRSAAGQGWLIHVPAVSAVFRLTPKDEESAGPDLRRRRSDEHPGSAPEPPAWLGLRFEAPRELTLPEFEGFEDRKNWWGGLLSLGAALAWHVQEVVAIQSDPVTGLPGRPQFQASLNEGLGISRSSGKPLCLLFINPDDFAGVNERFGREPSDRIIREISDHLRSSIRSSDVVAKYGGAIFVALLYDTPLSAAKVVAENVLRSLTERAYLDGAVRMGFSIGVATFDPKEGGADDVLDLIRRADQALNAAKRSGGGCIAVWEAGSEIEEIGQLDRLAGIFTGQMAKDYRNMVMLWDVLHLMAANLSSSELEEQVVERLHATLKQDRLALLGLTEDGQVTLKTGLLRRPGSGAALGKLSQRDFSPAELELIRQGSQQARLLEPRWTPKRPPGRRAARCKATWSRCWPRSRTSVASTSPAAAMPTGSTGRI